MRSQSSVVVFLMILRLFRWYAQKHTTGPMTISFVSDDRFERPGEHRQILIIYKPKSWESSSIQIKATWNWFLLCSMIRRDPEQLNLSLNSSWISLYFSTNFSSIDSPLIFIFSRGSAAASLFPILNHSHRFDSQSIYGRFFNLFILPAIFAVGFICFFRCARLKVIHGEHEEMKRNNRIHLHAHTMDPQELMGSMKRERITNKLFNFVLTWLEISCSFLSLLNSPFLHVSFDLVWRSRSHLFHFWL